jgi:hypothetical protein
VGFESEIQLLKYSLKSVPDKNLVSAASLEPKYETHIFP